MYNTGEPTVDLTTNSILLICVALTTIGILYTIFKSKKQTPTK